MSAATPTTTMPPTLIGVGKLALRSLLLPGAVCPLRVFVLKDLLPRCSDRLWVRYVCLLTPALLPCDTGEQGHDEHQTAGGGPVGNPRQGGGDGLAQVLQDDG